MTSKSIAECLGATGICVCPDFLSPISLIKTADDLDEIHAEGQFCGARVGPSSQPEPKEVIRSDETYWFKRENASVPQNQIWRRLDLLKRAFNRTLFLGLNDFEGHYSKYPAGGFYQRHKDCLFGKSNRIVSIIIYLNRDWLSHQGGRLRVYNETSHQDIDPLGGTMVCFMSRDSEHEVLLSHAERSSFAGWFKTCSSL